MFLRRNFRVALSWVVLFALLFNVALPTMAAMGTQAHPLAFAEICSASGIKRMALPEMGKSTEEHADLLHDGHCQLCVVHLAACPPAGDAALLPMQARPAYRLQELPLFALSEPARFLSPPSQAPPLSL